MSARSEGARRAPRPPQRLLDRSRGGPRAALPARPAPRPVEVRDGPHARDRPTLGFLPGLGESLPLLLFGGACLALSIYTFVARGQTFGGRIPLWPYLLGLGAIAVVGGLVSSTVGDDLEDLPKAGDRLGEDLVVVPLREWNALRRGPSTSSGSRSPALHGGGPGVRRTARPALAADGRSTAPSLPPSDPISAILVPAAPPYLEDEDWWHDALLRTGASPDEPSAWSPRAGAGASEVRDVLDTIDSIRTDLTTPRKRTPTARSRVPRAAALRPVPTMPVRSAPSAQARPASTGPVGRSAAEAVLESGLADLARELEVLTATRPDLARARPDAGQSAPPAKCAGCDAPSARGPTPSLCESCGRPLCAKCASKAEQSHHAMLCPMCAMLLDGSELT